MLTVGIIVSIWTPVKGCLCLLEHVSKRNACGLALAKRRWLALQECSDAPKSDMNKMNANRTLLIWRLWQPSVQT